MGTYTEVGYPREGTRQTVCKSLNDVWVTSRSAPNGLYWNTTVFLNPVCAGLDQFVVQPHLQLCHAIELNLGLSQRP